MQEDARRNRRILLLADAKANIRKTPSEILILYRELFFGAGKYPMWAGYAIGYYLVKSFLDGLDEISWEEVMKTHSSEILKKASP